MTAPDRTTSATGAGEHRWSLAGWIARWFTASVTLLALVLSGVGVLAVEVSTERELAALANEELEELHAFFAGSGGTPSDLHVITDRLGRRHPTNPLAWRVYDEADGSVWAEAGRTDLFELGLPLPTRSHELTSFEGGLRWRTTRLAPGLRVGLLLDANHQLDFARRFRLLSAVLVLATAACSAFVGWWLGRRVSRQLADVAAEARIVRNPADVVAIDQRQAPEEIREVADALQAMLRNIRSEVQGAQLITSGMAHELRSPIQNLLSETEVALLSEREPAEYRRVLESQLEDLTDLARAVDNLVTLCAASETRRGPVREAFDLGREVELRLARERQQAERRGLAFGLHLRGDLAIVGDREALLLAIGNLVRNATQWTAPGDRVEVVLEGDAGGIDVRVDDAGPGVPPDRQGSIFEPFVSGPRGDGQRAGYGLGLALARTAVEAHGGHIEVHGSPLGGASFRVRLPRADETSSDASGTPLAAPEPDADRPAPPWAQGA